MFLSREEAVIIPCQMVRYGANLHVDLRGFPQLDVSHQRSTAQREQALYSRLVSQHDRVSVSKRGGTFIGGDGSAESGRHGGGGGGGGGGKGGGGGGATSVREERGRRRETARGAEEEATTGPAAGTVAEAGPGLGGGKGERVGSGRGETRQWRRRWNRRRMLERRSGGSAGGERKRKRRRGGVRGGFKSGGGAGVGGGDSCGASERNGGGGAYKKRASPVCARMFVMPALEIPSDGAVGAAGGDGWRHRRHRPRHHRVGAQGGQTHAPSAPPLLALRLAHGIINKRTVSSCLGPLPGSTCPRADWHRERGDSSRGNALSDGGGCSHPHKRTRRDEGNVSVNKQMEKRMNHENGSRVQDRTKQGPSDSQWERLFHRAGAGKSDVKETPWRDGASGHRGCSTSSDRVDCFFKHIRADRQSARAHRCLIYERPCRWSVGGEEGCSGSSGKRLE
ncbi:Protein of unknown function [Gryllus bimaculatus]|nr:Protein of unknown function [Gryllus bimaculatus]